MIKKTVVIDPTRELFKQAIKAMKYQFKSGSITPQNIHITFKLIRIFSYAWMTLFLFSSALLALASIHKLPFTSVLGPVDAIIAFVIIGLTIYLHYLNAKVRELGLWNIPYQLFMRSLQMAGILLGSIIILMWNFRQEIDMNILLPGLAWRIFIVLNTIPFTIIGYNRVPD